MATPAFKFESEKNVEERVARLEANVEHIQSDVSDIKMNLRRLSDKMEAKFGDIMALITELKVGRAYDRVWYLLMSAALLAIMARAFKWI